jgi:hypothetical protein
MWILKNVNPLVNCYIFGTRCEVMGKCHEWKNSTRQIGIKRWYKPSVGLRPQWLELWRRHNSSKSEYNPPLTLTQNKLSKLTQAVRLLQLLGSNTVWYTEYTRTVLGFLRFLPVPPNKCQMPGHYLKQGNNWFLPHHLQFIIHKSSLHSRYIASVTNTVIKQTTWSYNIIK